MEIAAVAVGVAGAACVVVFRGGFICYMLYVICYMLYVICYMLYVI